MNGFETLPLFGEPDRPTVPPPPVVKVQWSNYRTVGRVQCMHCLAVAHARRGTGPVDIRGARRRRTGPDGELLLCTAHAEAKHAADVVAGLVPPPKGRALAVRRAA
ncbi:hypothetical protein RB614_20340 [Phytohabitans sp. ZYX-F-186]|uniref:Uncharacterized protein n=1 Tax=Phytohabitans maris TaxID=3071409 RepID=A0ABU0ZIK1_9ACTN|nr:hypothetical protein [Phytohabitans sp. ZYX-F-186]MDQ7906868.1 hypothetical protein [Phytohabitans sp. ZYX-F-186]